MNEAIAELRALLQKPQAGLRLVHLHLGRLENPAIIDRKAIRGILRDLGKRAAAWRLFDIANGDLIMLYQGVEYAAAEQICRDIAARLAETRLIGACPYPDEVSTAGPEGPLYHIFDLAQNIGLVRRYLETVKPAAG